MREGGCVCAGGGRQSSRAGSRGWVDHDWIVPQVPGSSRSKERTDALASGHLSVERGRSHQQGDRKPLKEQVPPIGHSPSHHITALFPGKKLSDTSSTCEEWEQFYKSKKTEPSQVLTHLLLGPVLPFHQVLCKSLPSKQPAALIRGAAKVSPRLSPN